MNFSLIKTLFGSCLNRRLIASGLCLLMTFQSADAYANAAKPEPQAVYEINLPSELGVIESFHQGTNGKTIIFIQDAHDSLEAQENIAKIIKDVVQNQNVKTVFEEGYEGELPTQEYFGDIQDPMIKEKLSYFLMDKLRLGGAEYAHINREQDFRLIGVDDRVLNDQNIKAYQEAFKLKDKTREGLKTLRTQLQKVAYEVFPNKIKNWIKLKERFDLGQIELIDYLKRTYELLGENYLGQNYPWIHTLLKADRFHDVESLEKMKDIDHQALFSEINRMERETAKLLIENEKEQTFFDYLQDLQLLERLNEIEVSADEYATMSRRLATIKTQEMLQFIAYETRKPIAVSKQWEENIKRAIRFYELAHQRDLRVGELIKKYSEDQNEETFALVFGGFHKNKISSILKQQGFSFYTVSPRISLMSLKHQNYYKEVMGAGHYDFETPLFATRAVKPLDVMDLEQYSPQMLLAIARNPGVDWALERDLLSRQLEQMDLWSESRAELRARKDEPQKLSVYQLIYEAIKAVRDAGIADRPVRLQEGEVTKEYRLLEMLENFQTAIRLGSRGEKTAMFDYMTLIPALDVIFEQVFNQGKDLSGKSLEAYSLLKQIPNAVPRSELRHTLDNKFNLVSAEARSLPNSTAVYYGAGMDGGRLADMLTLYPQLEKVIFVDENYVGENYDDYRKGFVKNLRESGIPVPSDFEKGLLTKRSDEHGRFSISLQIPHLDKKVELVFYARDYQKIVEQIRREDAPSGFGLSWIQKPAAGGLNIFADEREKFYRMAVDNAATQGILLMTDVKLGSRKVLNAEQVKMIDASANLSDNLNEWYLEQTLPYLLKNQYVVFRKSTPRSELRAGINVETLADHPVLAEPLKQLYQMGLYTYESHFGGENHSFSRPADQTDIQVGRLTSSQIKILNDHGFILPEPEYQGKKLQSWDSERHVNIGFKRNPQDSDEETKRIAVKWREIMDLLASATENKSPSFNNENMRYLDLAVATIFIFPVLMMIGVIAPWIKIANPSMTIFFTQTRLGYKGKAFNVYKLRTMDVAGHPIKLFGMSFGKFLRLTAIDEIPQILNVLKGDMSIFGPRPLAVGEVTEESLGKIFNYRKPGFFSLHSSKIGAGRGMNSIDLAPYIEAHAEELKNWSWRMPFVIFLSALQSLYRSLTKSIFELDDSQFADPKRVPRSEVTTQSENSRSELRTQKITEQALKEAIKELGSVDLEIGGNKLTGWAVSTETYRDQHTLRELGRKLEAQFPNYKYSIYHDHRTDQNFMRLDILPILKSSKRSELRTDDLFAYRKGSDSEEHFDFFEMLTTETSRSLEDIKKSGLKVLVLGAEAGHFHVNFRQFLKEKGITKVTILGVDHQPRLWGIEKVTPHEIVYGIDLRNYQVLESLHRGFDRESFDLVVMDAPNFPMGFYPNFASANEWLSAGKYFGKAGAPILARLFERPNEDDMKEESRSLENELRSGRWSYQEFAKANTPIYPEGNYALGPLVLVKDNVHPIVGDYARSELRTVTQELPKDLRSASANERKKVSSLRFYVTGLSWPALGALGTVGMRYLMGEREEVNLTKYVMMVFTFATIWLTLFSIAINRRSIAKWLLRDANAPTYNLKQGSLTQEHWDAYHELDSQRKKYVFWAPLIGQFGPNLFFAPALATALTAPMHAMNTTIGTVFGFILSILWFKEKPKPVSTLGFAVVITAVLAALSTQEIGKSFMWGIVGSLVGISLMNIRSVMQADVLKSKEHDEHWNESKRAKLRTFLLYYGYGVSSIASLGLFGVGLLIHALGLKELFPAFLRFFIQGSADLYKGGFQGFFMDDPVLTVGVAMLNFVFISMWMSSYWISDYADKKWKAMLFPALTPLVTLAFNLAIDPSLADAIRLLPFVAIMIMGVLIVALGSNGNDKKNLQNSTASKSVDGASTSEADRSELRRTSFEYVDKNREHWDDSEFWVTLGKEVWNDLTNSGQVMLYSDNYQYEWEDEKTFKEWIPHEKTTVLHGLALYLLERLEVGETIDGELNLLRELSGMNDEDLAILFFATRSGFFPVTEGAEKQSLTPEELAETEFTIDKFVSISRTLDRVPGELGLMLLNLHIMHMGNHHVTATFYEDVDVQSILPHLVKATDHLRNNFKDFSFLDEKQKEKYREMLQHSLARFAVTVFSRQNIQQLLDKYPTDEVKGISLWLQENIDDLMEWTEEMQTIDIKNGVSHIQLATEFFVDLQKKWEEFNEGKTRPDSLYAVMVNPDAFTRQRDFLWRLPKFQGNRDQWEMQSSINTSMYGLPPNELHVYIQPDFKKLFDHALKRMHALKDGKGLSYDPKEIRSHREFNKALATLKEENWVVYFNMGELDEYQNVESFGRRLPQEIRIKAETYLLNLIEDTQIEAFYSGEKDQRERGLRDGYLLIPRKLFSGDQELSRYLEELRKNLLSPEEKSIDVDIAAIRFDPETDHDDTFDLESDLNSIFTELIHRNAMLRIGRKKVPRVIVYAQPWTEDLADELENEWDRSELRSVYDLALGRRSMPTTSRSDDLSSFQAVNSAAEQLIFTKEQWKKILFDAVLLASETAFKIRKNEWVDDNLPFAAEAYDWLSSFFNGAIRQLDSLYFPVNAAGIKTFTSSIPDESLRKVGEDILKLVIDREGDRRSELRMFVHDSVRFDFSKAGVKFLDEHIETDKGVFRPTLSGMMEPIAKLANSTKPKKIIDMGSGQGAMVFAFAYENHEAEVLGIEFDPALYDDSVKVRETVFEPRKSRIRFEKGDFNDPKFAEEIQTADVINYWESGAMAEDALLENLSQYMRSGSYFLVTKNHGFILKKIENSGYFDLVKSLDEGIYLYRRNDKAYRSELRQDETLPLPSKYDAFFKSEDDSQDTDENLITRDGKFEFYVANGADLAYVNPKLRKELFELRMTDKRFDKNRKLFENWERINAEIIYVRYLGEIVGAQAFYSDENDKSHAYSNSIDLLVEPSVRRYKARDFDQKLRIGTRLIEQTMDYLRQNGYASFQVDIFPEDKSNMKIQKFYEKFIKNMRKQGYEVSLQKSANIDQRVGFRPFTRFNLKGLNRSERSELRSEEAEELLIDSEQEDVTLDDSRGELSSDGLRDGDIRLKMMSGETPGSGNLFDLRFGQTRLLLDAGKFPEKDFDTETDVDAVLVSHGHRDHIEALPELANVFPETPLLMSSPTALYGTNHWREAKHTKKDVERAISNTSIIREGVWYQLNHETKILFSPASHILGADLIYISTPKGNFLYTGDYSDENLRSVPNLQLLDDFEVDYLISESVYGDRPDVRDRDSSEKRLVEFTQETFSRGGNILIPGFTIGRIPEIVTILRYYQNKGEIDSKARLYIDGQAAMVMENYESYLSNSEAEEDKKLLELLFGKSSTIVYVKPWQRSRILNRSMPNDPRYIYLAGHGMLGGGRSVQALSTFANPKDSVIQVGYQGAGTLGRRILDKHLSGQSPIEISYSIDNSRQSVTIYNYEFIGFSAHASQKGLLKLIGDVNPRITVLIHGDDRAKAELKRLLKESVLLEKGHKRILTPNEGDELSFMLPKRLSEKRKKDFSKINAVSLLLGPDLVYELPELGSPNYDESRREFTTYFLQLLGQTHDSFNQRIMSRWIDAVHSGDLNKVIAVLRKNWKSVSDGEGSKREKEEKLSRDWDQIVNANGDLEDQYAYWNQRILKELKRPMDVHHKTAVRLYLDKEGPVAGSYLFMRELSKLRQAQDSLRVSNQRMWEKILESVGMEAAVVKASNAPNAPKNQKTPEQRLKEHVDDFSQKIQQALVAQRENSELLLLSLEEISYTVQAWLTKTALFWNGERLSTAKVASWLTLNHKAKEGSGIDWISMWNDISVRFAMIDNRSELRMLTSPKTPSEEVVLEGDRQAAKDFLTVLIERNEATSKKVTSRIYIARESGDLYDWSETIEITLDSLEKQIQEEDFLVIDEEGRIMLVKVSEFAGGFDQESDAFESMPTTTIEELLGDVEESTFLMPQDISYEPEELRSAVFYILRELAQDEEDGIRIHLDEIVNSLADEFPGVTHEQALQVLEQLADDSYDSSDQEFDEWDEDNEDDVSSLSVEDLGSGHYFVSFRSELRSASFQSGSYASKQDALYEKIWQSALKAHQEDSVPTPQADEKVFDVSLNTGFSQVTNDSSDFSEKLDGDLFGLSKEIQALAPAYKIPDKGQHHLTLFELVHENTEEPQSYYEEIKTQLSQALDEVVRAFSEVGEFDVILRGLSMGTDGTVFVKGYVEGNELQSLRQKLSDKTPWSDWRNRLFFHITIARLDQTITKENYGRLIEWVKARQDLEIGTLRVRKPSVIVISNKHATEVNQRAQNDMEVWNQKIHRSELRSFEPSQHVNEETLRKTIFETGSFKSELEKYGYDPEEVLQSFLAQGSVALVRPYGFEQNHEDVVQLQLLKEDFKKLIRQRSKEKKITFASFGLGGVPNEVEQVTKAFYETLASEGEDVDAWEVNYYGFDFFDLNLSAASQLVTQIENRDPVTLEKLTGTLNPNFHFQVHAANVYDFYSVQNAVSKLSNGQGIDADYIFERNVTYANEMSANGMFRADLKIDEERREWKRMGRQSTMFRMYLAQRNILLNVGRDESRGLAGSRYVVEPRNDRLREGENFYQPPGLEIQSASSLSLEIEFDAEFGTGILLLKDKNFVESASLTDFHAANRNAPRSELRLEKKLDVSRLMEKPQLKGTLAMSVDSLGQIRSEMRDELVAAIFEHKEIKLVLYGDSLDIDKDSAKWRDQLASLSNVVVVSAARNEAIEKWGIQGSVAVDLTPSDEDVDLDFIPGKRIRKLEHVRLKNLGDILMAKLVSTLTEDQLWWVHKVDGAMEALPGFQSELQSFFASQAIAWSA